MLTRIRNVLPTLTLFALLVVVATQHGCQPLKSYRQFYSIKVLLVSDRSPALVDNVIRLEFFDGEEPDDDDSVSGEVRTPDQAGVVEYARTFGAICVSGGNKNYPSCEEAAKAYDVTGTTFRFLVEEGDQSEAIDVEIEVGNRVFGDIYIIEVLSISQVDELR